MPTLEWIGKDKVINHHQDVPYRVLERIYSYDENGQHDEDNGSENMIIHGDNLEALKAVRDKSPVAISAGERLYNLKQFKDLFEMRAADYIQPDVSHAGGIMELKKIAAMADTYYIPFAPHNPSGPVACAASLQLAACTTNFSILEIMYSDVPWRKDVTNESLHYENGFIDIPDKPGLGIEINEDECLKHPYKPHTLRHYTGALTDIRPPESEFYF